ncbi:alcohol dehydrogenase [Yersinia entomophaga]|uniref:Alcohol dehydrogenase n=1 Tax=Yersinia entomophaga TaxID=935293 RepID=A0ABM6BQ37_YERET|nr:NAD(P)-dependent alcohol dehydrogenase [Yersinia entomophaga]ANI31797.1 alcohol dehydrogenase [Yersinia entomophaga]OWF85971.1 NAD(P)-dependent alcohol dehydrogenase [Yersinia entomophaga]
MNIHAAVSVESNPLLQIRQLRLEEPRENEVLVKIIATGLCHTDIASHQQVINVPLPAVLGHEGAGIVERVGSGVKHIQPGDHVVLSLASCGECEKCHIGLPTYCREHWPLNWHASRSDKSVSLQDPTSGEAIHSHFFGQSSFANYATVNVRSVVPVDKTIPLEYLGPLACGMMTGAGAVLNSLKPEAGSSIAIFGMEAVGLAAIMAAVLAGCTTIIAVDIKANRLTLAKSLGATHSIDSSKDRTRNSLPMLLQELTDGRGVDYVVEAAGSPAVMESAIAALAENGQCVLTGVVAPNATLPLNIMHLLRGRLVRGSIMGDAAPISFIPRLASLFQQGRFPVDKLVRFYALDQINQAMADSQSGSTIKAVIKMQHLAV